jgi:hypothetical protein
MRIQKENSAGGDPGAAAVAGATHFSLTTAAHLSAGFLFKPAGSHPFGGW